VIDDLDDVKVLEHRLGSTYPDMPWEPKAAFSALADCHRSLADATSIDQVPTVELELPRAE
jgi:hypothetical protein